MSFVWALEVARSDGTVACRTPLLPDWRAASGWVRFQGIRRGALPPVLTREPGEVEPVWDAERGAPYAAAARISIRPPGGAGEAVRDEVPVACLAGQVADVLRVLVQAGQLAQGELVYPKVCAHGVAELPAEDVVASAGAGAGIGIEEIPNPLRLRATPIDRFRRVATPRNLAVEEDDLPVFIPLRVLAETERIARASADVETGGFLVGHLHRDATSPECFVEVTGQIPARHTVAERTRLTFTPDTWAAAEADVRSRGRDEEIVSFWHLHPFFCRPCPPERRRTCTLDSTFFSAEDVALLRLCMPQAYKFALLLSEREGGEIEHALFGWRRGLVAARGFHEIPDPSVPAARLDIQEVTA